MTNVLILTNDKCLGPQEGQTSLFWRRTLDSFCKKGKCLDFEQGARVLVLKNDQSACFEQGTRFDCVGPENKKQARNHGTPT